MSTSTIILLVILGVVLVIASVLLRVFSGGKYEIRTIDLVFLVIPLLLVALVTGKLKGIDLFGVKADLSELWAAAAQTKIERQVASMAPTSVQDIVQAMEMGSKGGTGTQELQRLLERNTEALEFKLGYGGYYGPAIKEYFGTLSGSLRVIVINEPDGKLFGVYQASDLIGYLRVVGYEQFQRLLNSGTEAARAELAKLPGFVSVDEAVTATTSKRDALTRMEKLDVDNLPVVDEQQRFLGTVQRSKLTAGLILLITDKLESP